MPLFSLPAKPVNKNKRPLGVIRRDVNRRKAYQRICRNADFVAIKIQVNVHEESLHEAGMDVNLGNKDLRQKILAQVQRAALGGGR